MAGTKIYAVPDFAFRDVEGRVRIYDWKSGQPRETDRSQLAVYLLYARAMGGDLASAQRLADQLAGAGIEHEVWQFFAATFGITPPKA